MSRLRHGRSSRLTLAVASGFVLWMSFPPLGIWLAGPIAVAGLSGATWRTSKRLAALAGFVFGLAFLGALLSFVRVFGLDAWLALAAGEAAFFAGLGIALRQVSWLRWWPLADAGVWLLEEAIRDRVPFHGFPWGRLADAQAGGPLGRLAAIGGAPLVSFAVALAGGLMALTVAQLWRRAAPLAGIAPALAGAAVVVCIGLAVPLPTAGTTTGGPASVQIAGIQGNVPRLGLAAFAQRYAVTQNMSNLTVQLAREVKAGTLPAPQIVVWPENASDNDPYRDPEAHLLVTRAVDAVGVPTLIGAVLDGPGPTHVRNAGIVWSPTTGPGEVYIKRYLVPFGEYLPFRAELSKWIGRFSLLPYDFVPGNRPGVLTLGPTKIADVICFEVSDDSIVRQAVTGGGRLIVVQTNDASYEHAGDTGVGGESAQQLAISRLRAIEHGRSVVVVSTSGLSAVVSPDGKVLQRTAIFRPAILDTRVALRDPLTIADRIGDVPEWIFVALGVIALIAAWRERRRLGPDRDVSDSELTIAHAA